MDSLVTEPAKKHENLAIKVTKPEDVSLTIFKSLPEFTGDREKYATWKSVTRTAIKLMDEHKQSMRYFEALMVVRNKITGAASNILNNYNTPFNFEAIIDQLDFTYADKRPLYIIEQELLVLQQDKLSVDEFFDLVNEKLNQIVNKINLTYEQADISEAFIEGANEKALRTFVTGLSNRKGQLLYASKPKSLPEAYAMLQTIIHDQQRINFSNQYNFDKNDSTKFAPSQSNKLQIKTTEADQNWRRINDFKSKYPTNGGHLYKKNPVQRVNNVYDDEKLIQEVLKTKSQNSQNYHGIHERLKTAQDTMLKFENKSRISKQFKQGDVIFVKNNRRDKRAQTHTQHIVKKDWGMTIETNRGTVIHKDSIRN